MTATSRRKICVLTGNRAEYGLLHWTMKEIAGTPDLALQVIATGAHLEPAYGMTVRHIEEDGFAIDARVPMALTDSSAVGVAHSTAIGLEGITRALAALRPDILMLLGDRFEVHAAATAAMLSRTPIAHIHGGESTEGLIDEAIRHAVTKMSHLHFVAADAYRDRVIQLGESPDRVFVVGATGLDNLERLALRSRSEVEAAIGFRFGDGYLMVTYHPVTLRPEEAEGPVSALLAALDAFPDRQVLITGTNADPGGDRVRQMIHAFAAARPERVCLRDSLGQLNYLSALKSAAAIVGNSSSGLLEAPSLGVPTVNIGDRQRGRLRSASVIDCAETEEAVAAAIRRAVDPGFRKQIDPSATPYGKAGAAVRIRDVLRCYPLDGILLKRFHDLPVPR